MTRIRITRKDLERYEYTDPGNSFMERPIKQYAFPETLEVDLDIDPYAVAGELQKDMIDLRVQSRMRPLPPSPEPPPRKPLEIVPSQRIDYCVGCDAEHGYECPKDKPAKIPQLHLGWPGNQNVVEIRDVVNKLIRDYNARNGY